MAVYSRCMKGRRIFYGWWIILASCVGLSANPGQFAFGALGLFIIPFNTEFGWDRGRISLALTIFTAGLVVAMPLLGRLVDRRGSRQVLLPSLVVYGLLLGSIALFVSRLWHLWLIFLLLGTIGAGANATPYLRIIGAWFDRRRGLAYGIAMAGGGLGYAYVPPLLQYLIDHYGWRAGYFTLSALVLLMALPIVSLVLRNTPGEMGAFPDNNPEHRIIVQQAAEARMHVGELVRSRVFWVLFGVFCALSLCLYGLLAHLVPMLIDRGMATSRAALAASVLGMTIVLSRVFIGYLIDRFFAPRVAMICILLSAGGLALLAGGAVNTGAFVAAALAGLSIGAEIDLLAYLSTRYFGLEVFGVSYGMLFSGFLIGAASGPYLYGRTFDVAKSYAPALTACSALLVLTALALLWLPRYGAPGAPRGELS